jgi:hypothetical protein
MTTDDVLKLKDLSDAYQLLEAAHKEAIKEAFYFRRILVHAKDYIDKQIHEYLTVE